MTSLTAEASANPERLGATVVDRGFDELRGAVGTPAQIRAYLRGLEECGVDQVIFVSQAGYNRHEHIIQSMELFAAEVLPEFADRAEDRERTKMARLQRATDAALARKPADDHPPPPQGWL